MKKMLIMVIAFCAVGAIAQVLPVNVKASNAYTPFVSNGFKYKIECPFQVTMKDGMLSLQVEPGCPMNWNARYFGEMTNELITFTPHGSWLTMNGYYSKSAYDFAASYIGSNGVLLQLHHTINPTETLDAQHSTSNWVQDSDLNPWSWSCLTAAGAPSQDCYFFSNS